MLPKKKKKKKKMEYKIKLFLNTTSMVVLNEVWQLAFLK